MNRSRRLIGAGVALATALAATGCVRVHGDVEVYTDDTVEMTMEVAIADYVLAAQDIDPLTTLEDALGTDDLEADLEGLATRNIVLTMTDFHADGQTGIRLDMERVSIDDLTAAQIGKTNFTFGVYGASLVREGDIFIYEAPASELAPDLQEIAEDPLAAAAINFSITIAFPGDVIESSYGHVSGRYVTYSLNDVLLGEPLYIRANAVPTDDGLNPLFWIVPVVVFIAVVLIGVFIVAPRRRRVAATDSAE